MDGFRVTLLLCWPEGCRQGQVSSQAVCGFLSIFTRGDYKGIAGVFGHLYARHANTRKPVSVAVSAVAYKRVSISLQNLWASTYKRSFHNA
jgi:hypothetical protein